MAIIFELLHTELVLACPTLNILDPEFRQFKQGALLVKYLTSKKRIAIPHNRDMKVGIHSPLSQSNLQPVIFVLELFNHLCAVLTARKTWTGRTRAPPIHSISHVILLQ